MSVCVSVCLSVATDTPVVADDGSERLRNVEFPAVKSSNVQPVQTTADYLQQFNVTSGWDEPSSPLPDKNLIVIKWEFRMPGETVSPLCYGL